MKERVFVETLRCATPEHRYSTTELLAPVLSRTSDELRGAVAELRVDERYSAVADLPDYLAGRRPLSVASGTTALAARAARECLDESGVDCDGIGLVVAASNSQERTLPGLAPDLLAKLAGRIPRSIPTVSIQGQGCSSLLKAVEVAEWYLASHKKKKVLVVVAEVQTPYMQRFGDGAFLGFREIHHSGLGDSERPAAQQRTLELIQNLLFGDGAWAAVLGADDGPIAVGAIAHLTNDEEGDAELLVMGHGSGAPELFGIPAYAMSPRVPQRGLHYARQTASDVHERTWPGESLGARVKSCFIHTGSVKILSKVCTELGFDPASPAVRVSFELLRTHANVSSASIGFMLAEALRPDAPRGPALAVSFGVGFSATSAILRLQ